MTTCRPQKKKSIKMHIGNKHSCQQLSNGCIRKIKTIRMLLISAAATTHYISKEQQQLRNHIMQMSIHNVDRYICTYACMFSVYVCMNMHMCMFTFVSHSAGSQQRKFL